MQGHEEIDRAETKKETDQKCPSCGGTMDFTPSTGGLACPYCGHTQAIETTMEEAMPAEELEFESTLHKESFNWGMRKKTVICKSCGAESIYDALQVSSECPYCGSNQVMEEKEQDTLAPGGVCVFAVDAKKAGEHFSKWIRRKWFCPRIAKEKAKPEAMHGVYLPFWTFDANTESKYTCRYGISRTVSDKDGNKKTVTDWHSASGLYRAFIDDQIVSGTTRHDERILKQLEPFHATKSVAYKPEYMAGFLSERYSIGLKDAWEKAKGLIRKTLQSGIAEEVTRHKRADRVDSVSFTTAYSNIKYKYLLMPVWISGFTYNGKPYQFMVNGQTGRVGGKSPVSALRVCFAVLLGIALLALLLYLGEYVG